MHSHDNLGTHDKQSICIQKGAADLFSVEVNCVIQLFDEHGNLKDQRTVHNTVTTAGKAGITDQILAAPTLTKMGWMALGTGSPAANALGVETVRVAFDSKTRSTNVITVQGTFAAGVATGALTEAGTFDAVSVGNAWMTTSYAVVNKGALDSIVVTWTLTIN